MNIDSIRWPTNAKEACHLYLGFVLQVVEGLEFDFPDSLPDPVTTATAYVQGRISEEAYRSEVAPWWDSLDASGAIREMRERPALTTRLAICLLSATTDQAPKLGEHLSWFLEVLGFMNVDLSEPIRKMEEHFGREEGQLGE